MIHTWHDEIHNDFVNFNFHSIKLNDNTSASGNIMINSCSMLEVMKDVSQATSKLNGSYWLNVGNIYVLQIENKELIAKVDRVKNESKDIKTKFTNASYDERSSFIYLITKN